MKARTLIDMGMTPVVLNGMCVGWFSDQAVGEMASSDDSPFYVTVNNDSEFVIEPMDIGGLGIVITIRTNLVHLEDLETVMIHFDKMLREIGQ